MRRRRLWWKKSAPSVIWKTTEMDKLLNHEEHYDQITGVSLEKINVDLCTFNLKDQTSGLLHKERTGLVMQQRAPT